MQEAANTDCSGNPPTAEVKAVQAVVETDTETHSIYGQRWTLLVSLPLLDIYLVILSQELQILYHLKWGA